MKEITMPTGIEVMSSKVSTNTAACMATSMSSDPLTPSLAQHNHIPPAYGLQWTNAT